jgi:ketosteroid isomerase-like protein
MRRIVVVMATLVCAPPLIAVAQTDPSKDVEAVEHARMDAVGRRDREAIARFLADDFAAIDGRGRFRTRDQYLEGFRPGSTPIKLVHDEVLIRMYGATAIITGRSAITRADGAPGFTRYTHVYVKQATGWKMVAMHNSNVEAPPVFAASK